MKGMRYWLIKSEPDVFSVIDLKKVNQEPGDRGRNYQARNFMGDDKKPGDLALLYQSNTKVSGAVGEAKMVSLQEMVTIDPSVNGLHAMPLGACAERAHIDADWEAFKI